MCAVTVPGMCVFVLLGERSSTSWLRVSSGRVHVVCSIIVLFLLGLL